MSLGLRSPPCVAAALVALTALTPSVARAQQFLVGGSAEVASGASSGGRDRAAGLRRARTAVRLGADLRIDEAPREIYQGGLLLELEPTSAVGSDLRYARRAARSLVLHAGAVGFVLPETLVGVTVGGTWEPDPSPGASFQIGPTVQVFGFGSDLPSGTVLWQALLVAGFRVDL